MGTNCTFMGGDNGFTNGKPDAHAFGTVGGRVAGVRCSVKNCPYPFRGDADAVIAHMENNGFPLYFDMAGDRLAAFGMQDSIFQ